jgi:hypothetical protein
MIAAGTGTAPHRAITRICGQSLHSPSYVELGSNNVQLSYRTHEEQLPLVLRRKIERCDVKGSFGEPVMEPWISRITFSSVVIRNYLRTLAIAHLAQQLGWQTILEGGLTRDAEPAQSVAAHPSFPSSLADLLAWINCVAWECMHVCN